MSIVCPMMAKIRPVIGWSSRQQANRITRVCYNELRLNQCPALPSCFDVHFASRLMSYVKTASRFLLAIFTIGAGVMHFVRPEFYVKIMPPYLPWHLPLVYISGVCEAALGALLLVPR